MSEGTEAAAFTRTWDGHRQRTGPATMSHFVSAVATAMPGRLTALALSRLFVHVFPLAFVVVSWVAGAGYPYYIDNNETLLHYVAARNLEIWDPWAYGWMTAEESDPQQTTAGYFYTHNPNGPRYLQYALLRAGIHEMAPQTLILGFVGTLASVMLLWRIVAPRALLVVALAVVLDYAGFLAWTLNTYRIWMFVFFFGLVVAARGDRRFWFGVLMFLVFQLDYGVAAFVAGAAVALALLIHGWRGRWLVCASSIGALLSLALFGAQVVAFYGWDGFLNELAVTYARRGPAGDPSGPAMFLYHAWRGPVLLGAMMARVTHNPAVLVVVVSGIVFSIRSLLVRCADESERFLARLTLASTAGAIVSSAALYGYFVDGFVNSLLPLSVLLIAPAAGVVSLRLRLLLARWWNLRRLGAFCGVVALLPVVVASVTHFRPPLGADLFARLQTEYRGRTIVAPNPGPHFADAELSFALTGGRALRTSDLIVTPEDMQRFASLRDADGTLTYVCLDTMYLRWSQFQDDVLNLCGVASDLMVARGHTVVESGPGWVIMNINRDDDPTASDSDQALTEGQP